MFRKLSLIACLSAGMATAQDRPEMVDDEFGTSNIEELSMRGALMQLRHKNEHPLIGVIGYGAAKAGMHDEAREIFTQQAEIGNVQAITWLSWMEDNGLGAPENPERAAELDRQAMSLGSAVGAFNYGLDLLRGRGVKYDAKAGRAIIRQAAAMGDASAQHLIENDYDLDSVTPDADEWKYEKRLF